MSKRKKTSGDGRKPRGRSPLEPPVDKEPDEDSDFELLCSLALEHDIRRLNRKARTCDDLLSECDDANLQKWANLFMDHHERHHEHQKEFEENPPYANLKWFILALGAVVVASGAVLAVAQLALYGHFSVSTSLSLIAMGILVICLPYNQKRIEGYVPWRQKRDLLESWPLLKKRRQELENAKLRFSKFKPLEDNESSKCLFCWSHFSESRNGKSLNQGYVTQSGNCWICAPCFKEHRELFKWQVDDSGGLDLF